MKTKVGKVEGNPKSGSFPKSEAGRFVIAFGQVRSLASVKNRARCGQLASL
ncbi:hypothetical protein [Paenibacillus stellifer]|uniref:hypothetical protein n=1 Tax=Paenibacillus stellifer TaxID=169760 RepID=UPI000AD560A4|nr:hypothetical protein [Paenibacillus stellifer]